MSTGTKNTTAQENQDPRFVGVNYHCLLPGKSEHKCDHWGCKVTAKQPQYYQGLKKFFEDRGDTRFHVRKTKAMDFTQEEIIRMPKDMRLDRAWLTPMTKGDGTKPNLNTEWIIEARGYWPDRSIYNADEVAFIHEEYKTLRGKPNSEIRKIIATQIVNKDNFHLLLNESVMDVKEVAIFTGKEVMND